MFFAGAMSGIAGGMIGGYMGSPNMDLDAIVQDVHYNEIVLEEVKRQNRIVQEDIICINRNCVKMENFILLSSLLNICKKWHQSLSTSFAKNIGCYLYSDSQTTPPNVSRTGGIKRKNWTGWMKRWQSADNIWWSSPSMKFSI